MSDVQKIKEACFLACLKSFLDDNQIILSQEDMIKILISKKLCDTNGIVPFPFENMCEASLIFGIKISEVSYHYPIDKKYEDGSLLIGRTSPGLHCMRFFKQPEAEKILVMDPDHGKTYWWDKTAMENTKPKYYKLELLK